MEQRHFCQASLQYVCLLQQVQERKKFEFVEPVIFLVYFVDGFIFLFEKIAPAAVAGFYVRLAHILSPRA
jgi:BAR domain of APPL family